MWTEEVIFRRPACVAAMGVIQEYRFSGREISFEGIGFNRAGQLVCWNNETAKRITSQEVLSWVQRMESNASDELEPPKVGGEGEAAEKWLRVLAAQLL